MTKISALPVGTAPTGAESIPAVQGGQTVSLLVSQTSATVTAGPATPTAALTQAVDWLWGTAAAKTLLINEGSIWAGKVYSGFGFSKQFTTANDSAVANTSPNVGLFVAAENAGANNDVVAVIGDTLVSSANQTGFGANFIARNAAVNGTKLVGVEIDVEFAAGTTAGAGSAGLYINGFNVASIGPAIQTGGVGGGTWTNGIVLDGIVSTGAGVAPNAGTAMGSLINTGTATYSSDAAIFSNAHKLRFSGTASAHAKMYNDNANSLRIVGGSVATVIRNNADGASLVTVLDNGNITATGVLSVSAGSNTTPAINFGDTGTGFYRNAANAVAVSTNGTAIWCFFSNGAILPLVDNGFAIGSSTNRPSAVYGVAFFGGAGLQVVGARKTGWAVATGTPTRTTFDTATVTLPLLAERVKALIDDLHATAGHGLIGT